MTTKRYKKNGKFSALLISPKSREVLFAQQGTGSTSFEVDISYPGKPDKVIGSGWLDNTEDYEIEREVYQRSHSAKSGVEIGVGHGSALYYGLCLLAYSELDVDGIASSEEAEGHHVRTKFARVLWQNQLHYGLAEEAYIEGGTEEDTYEFDPDNYLGDLVDCEFVGDSKCESIEGVSTDTHTVVTYTKQSDSLEVQYMPTSLVVEAKVILGWEGSRTVEFEIPPPEVLAGLDLSNCYSVELVEDIIGYVRKAGLEIDYIRNMLRKLPEETYRGAVKQLELPLTANRRSLRPNQDVERAVSEAWDRFYGDLAKV